MTPPQRSAPAHRIPGIPQAAEDRLLALFTAQPHLDALWLFGSRAMERHHSGSDIDLCLEGPLLRHLDRLRLLAAVEELLLPWQVDLVLRHELPADLDAHLQRVGRCLWKASEPHPWGRSAEP
jgi:predicted nucleotidyltransferase